MNPLRYKGYICDEEVGFYLTGARYYDPEIGGFINADSQLNISQGILGTNMFVYCLNNPINMSDPAGNKPGDLFDTVDEAARDAAIYLGKLLFENEWEYATCIYSVTPTIKTYRTVTTTHKFLWWSWTSTSTETVRIRNTQCTYKAVVTNEDAWSVYVPEPPSLKKSAAVLHTHPMGSARGITRFSDPDKEWADFSGIPLYVHGPNGKLRKYNPATQEDIPIFDDLPLSPNTPWLN